MSHRDRTRFPDDAIGDQLWAHARAGDVQTVPRAITVSIEMPTVTSTAAFIDELEDLLPEREPDHVRVQTLDVTVTMVPDHAELQALLLDLQDLAQDHGAELMGWDFVPVLRSDGP